MMNRKEFYEYVKDNVKEYLPESYKDAEIKLQEVVKNNGLKFSPGFFVLPVFFPLLSS